MSAKHHKYKQIHKANAVRVENHLAIWRFVFLHRQLLNISNHSIKQQCHRDDKHTVARELWRHFRVGQCEENEANAHGKGGKEVHCVVLLLLDENRADEHRNKFTAFKDDLHRVV